MSQYPRITAAPPLLLCLTLTLVALVSSPSSRAASGFPSFADLVESNAPAIVEIQTTQRVNPRELIPGQDIEELLRQLPDVDPESLAPPPEQQQIRPGAVGSGFLMTADGYVVTNYHVVSEAEEILVELNDRRVYPAEVIGMDEPSDLALLKLDGQDLPHIEFGDSDRLRVGEWVLAIGSPFGLEFSAAAGIVSAKGRSINRNSSYSYMSFIQTDVAINQGNSGGPLFNLEGEVVGINSQILSSSGGSNGISFSIPSNIALNVIDQLQTNGRVQRGLLGVIIGEVTYQFAEIFGVDRPRGAFVQSVQPGSPAQTGGVQSEDIVLEFNDHLIEDSLDLPFYVGQYQPGTESTLVVFRNGEILPLTVVLGASPTNNAAETAAVEVPERSNPLGFDVAELGREARQVTGLSGVRITAVEPGPGRAIGLRQGDVVVSLNRTEIDSVDQYYQTLSELPEHGFVPIRIVREGSGSTLALDLGR
ncbi:MAG: Do family serine endopeptidase [Pseudohongiellaceae bacterium]